MKDDWKYDLTMVYLEGIRPIDFFIFYLLYALFNAHVFGRAVSETEMGLMMALSVLGHVLVTYVRRRRRRDFLWYDLDDFMRAHRDPADRRERPLWLKSRE